MRKSNGFSARQLTNSDLHPLLCGVALRLNLSRGAFYDAVDRCSLPCVAMADGVANAGEAATAESPGLIAPEIMAAKEDRKR